MPDDGTSSHSLRTLFDASATIVRNSCRTRAVGPEALTFALCAAADPRQKRALALLETIVTQPAREP